jgi:hypothetical protein
MTPIVLRLKLLTKRIGQARPFRLVLRLTTAAAASGLVVAGVGWQPASLAICTGALTWLALTAPRDLGRRRRD